MITSAAPRGRALRTAVWKRRATPHHAGNRPHRTQKTLAGSLSSKETIFLFTHPQDQWGRWAWDRCRDPAQVLMGHPNSMYSPGRLFGEDHLLVWAAFSPVPTHTTLETKPRVSQQANITTQYYQKTTMPVVYNTCNRRLRRLLYSPDRK